MSLSTKLRILCRLLVLLSVALLAAPAHSQPWVQVRSPNFSVVTDGGEKRGREVALRFEQMRSVFGTLFNKSVVNLPVPLQIIAFRSSKEMRQYVGLWKGKPIEAAGLFQGGEDRNFILLDLSLEQKWTTVFHEYAHLLLNGNFPSTALWFDEGFADFFSTLQINNKTVEIGGIPEDAGYILGRSRFMAVVDLFSVGPDSKIYNQSGDGRHLFYAQSWLVVHYIFDNKKLAEADEYFRLVNEEKASPADAIRRAFHLEPGQFEKAIEDYYHGRAKLWRVPLQLGLDSSGYKVTSMDPLDAQVVLADLHQHSRDYADKAIQEFESVLRIQPDNAGAHRGLGYGYMRKGDLDQGAQHFRRAAELDPDDPRVRYYSALLMDRMGGAQLPQEHATRMKKQLEVAIALDPGYADAYSLLGVANAALGDLEAAIANQKKAVELSPRSEPYAFNLAVAYVQVRKWDEARAILQRLKDSKSPQLAAKAADLLHEVERTSESPAAKVAAGQSARRDSYEAPQWRRQKPEPPEEEEERRAQQEPAATSIPPKAPIKFLKGRLVNVDCSPAPAAIFTISSGTRTLKMVARDAKKLIVIGADQLSCSWKNIKVAVNYRETGKADGELVSLEIQ